MLSDQVKRAMEKVKCEWTAIDARGQWAMNLNAPNNHGAWIQEGRIQDHCAYRCISDFEAHAIIEKCFREWLEQRGRIQMSYEIVHSGKPRQWSVVLWRDGKVYASGAHASLLDALAAAVLQVEAEHEA
jgi:hypothetical protein